MFDKINDYIGVKFNGHFSDFFKFIAFWFAIIVLFTALVVLFVVAVSKFLI